MRVAIFGAGGQLGVELTAEFQRRGYEVASFDKSRADITKAEQVEQALSEFSPAVVVNSAAYNQVDKAESEPAAAYDANALAVRNLAVACRQTGARLVHFSTDYVFDGQSNRPYREEDPTHPLGAYAVSKLAGELYASAYLDRPLIIRTCGVFGPRTVRGNFVELMLRLAGQNQPIRVVEDFIASPTFAPALASRSVDLVEKEAAGVFHLGGSTPISWFEWARMIFAAASLEPDLNATNERDFHTAARRPKYSALSNAKAESLGVAPMPSLDQAIRDYLEARARNLAPA